MRSTSISRRLSILSPAPSPNTENCRLWSHRKNPTVDRNLPYGQKAEYASNWEDVPSGIPQGSVLGPTLFVMFINDMPDAITSLSKMFADNAKVFIQIENRADIATLQKDLDHLTDWSLKWQMNFNIKKCKRLHIGQTNPHNSYTIAGIDLDESDQEHDLGIIVDNKLKFHIQ